MAEEFKEIDEEKFFDLIKDYKSDDFKRSRRGLTLTSFIVILIFSLDLPIEKIKFFSVGLDNKYGATPIFWIGLMLILYWGTLFALYLKSDHEMQKEKYSLFIRQVYIYEEEFEKANELAEQDKIKNRINTQNDLKKRKLKALLDKHTEQKDRTETAKQLGAISKYVEIGIPLGMGILAIGMLCILLFLPR
jgi:hypothetical protein